MGGLRETRNEEFARASNDSISGAVLIGTPQGSSCVPAPAIQYCHELDVAVT